MPSCYYYDEQRNRCNCYVNENLNELLAENERLRKLVVRMYKSIRWSDMTSDSMFSVSHSDEKDMRELRIEVPR